MVENFEGADEPITNKRILVEYLEAGCKPKTKWKIGTEHEKFPYHLTDLSPLTYAEEKGILRLLTELQRFGWKPVSEDGRVIALSKDGDGTISLEPSGQLELSGEAVDTIHKTCDQVSRHLQQVKAVASELGIGFLGIGYRPTGTVEEAPWMPKARYKIMRKYMPKKGNLGLEMMTSTCTVQANLDFDSELTMVKMFRVSLALQPVATALWANSPFRSGKPSGYLSFRSHIWTETDPDRCGTLPFVFEEGFGFERYVEYLLDIPMYFIYRDKTYLDASGLSFRDFIVGKLHILPGEQPKISDWVDHLSVAFPEVRLKQFLEMRGADGGSWANLCALPAFWVGLLYDSDSLSLAYNLVSDWSQEEHDYLRKEVPRTALKTQFRGRSIRELALDVLEIAHSGLKKRERLDSVGIDEAHFLKPLFQIAESDLTPAEELLRAYERRWKKSVYPVYSEYAY